MEKITGNNAGVKRSGKWAFVGIIAVCVLVLVIVGVLYFVLLNDSEKKTVADVDAQIADVVAYDFADESISSLEEEIEAVDTLVKTYEALSWKEKMHITDYDKVASKKTEIEGKIAEINQEKAQAVVDKINALDSSPKNDTAITEAEKAYNVLSDDQKELVDNYDTLTTLRTNYDTAAAKVAVQKINKIGEVKYNQSSKKRIHAAEVAYNSLSTEAKKMVENYNVLKGKKAKYQKLEKKVKEKKNIESAKKSIKITSMYFIMDYAGGLDVYIKGYNNSGKTIKDLKFTIKILDASGEALESDFLDTLSTWTTTGCFLEVEDTVQPGGHFGNVYWPKVFYNLEAHSISLQSVKIKFQDGTSKKITKKYLKYIK
jgi:hypothetical protein